MSNYNEEREEYKKKVDSQRKAIDNLLDLSEHHSGLFDFGMIKQLKNYKLKCDKLYRKLDKNEFEIAIVGLEKAGKSTFGNALMENRILPDADERCTYTSTCIRYGEDRAIVKFFNHHEMDELLRGYLTTLGIEKVDAYTYQGLSKAEYLSLFSKIDKRDQERYSNTVHQDILNLLDNKSEILTRYVGKKEEIFEGEDLYSDEFKAYIVSPQVAVAVKEVCIEASKLGNLQNAVIYDVPGFDSPTSMHLEQTKERMKEADAIMLIAAADKPSFTAPALNMFQEVVDEDNVSLNDKLFIFGNKADGATDLAKNIQTLKSEARRWRLLSDSQLDERLMVGSAKGHLQKTGVLTEDRFCIDKIENDDNYKKAWAYGDGIEHAYKKLVKYNENERFAVMKKKIQRNNEELFELFKEVKDKYADGSFGINFNEMRSAITELRANARVKIKKDLEELRFEITEKYSKEPVLSKRLQEKVISLFNDDRFDITEEDVHNAEITIQETGMSPNVERVEELIRTEKFNRIYGDFSNSAFAVAQNDHTVYFERIISSFENALNINSNSVNYEKLHNLINEYVETCKKNKEDEFIYQSVIERFVRDVVEILINRPYSSEARLNKFVDEVEILSGLVMFYDTGDADEGYKRQFLSVSPKNHPLLLSLVFHDYIDSDETSKNVMDYLGSLGGTVSRVLCDNPEVIQLAFSIIKQDPINGLDSIRKMIDKNLCKNCKTEDEFVRTVVPALRKVRSSNLEEEEKGKKRYEFDFTNKEKFGRQYKEYFGNTAVRTYENVPEFFAKDLQILEKFLVHASIPAIRLEKPFVAREVQSINKLLELVNSTSFDALVDENAELLLPGVYESLSIAIDNSYANKAAVAEVEKIFKTLECKE